MSERAIASVKRVEEESVADINRMAVIGLGTMGHGIAQTYAVAGHEVRVYDDHEPARDSLLLPPDAPLSGVARLDVDLSTEQALVEGRAGVSPPDAAGPYRCYGPRDRFLGLVEAAAGTLRPVRLARTDAKATPGRSLPD